MKIKAIVEIYNAPKVCNGGKDWDDSCLYLSEYNSCELFRMRLKHKTINDGNHIFVQSFKCPQCLKSIALKKRRKNGK